MLSVWGVPLALALLLALEPPAAPTARVNDYAELLTPVERRALEESIATRERATGAQVAIAIFRSLQGENLEDFSIRLAERWRIGQKGLDNGVIVLVFVGDRKVRLEVGYGLEPVIPDVVAGRIIAEAIAPRFRQQRYADGLEAAVREIYGRVEAGPRAPAPSRAPGVSWPVAALVLLFVVVAIVLGLEARRSQQFVGRRGYTASRRGWSGPVIVPGPWWGGGWGRRGGGGDDSWGGFSGGGGRFGGGGASGSW